MKIMFYIYFGKNVQISLKLRMLLNKRQFSDLFIQYRFILSVKHFTNLKWKHFVFRITHFSAIIYLHFVKFECE